MDCLLFVFTARLNDQHMKLSTACLRLRYGEQGDQVRAQIAVARLIARLTHGKHF